jgi:hypothetical protein
MTLQELSTTMPLLPRSRSTRKTAAPPTGYPRRERAYNQPSAIRATVNFITASLARCLIPFDHALFLDPSKCASAWIIDFGCTKHIVPSLSDLTTITDGNPPFSTISVANKERLPIRAICIVTIRLVTSTSNRVPVALLNVLVVPGIASRLFSCRWGFELDGIRTKLNSECCLLLPDGSHTPFNQQQVHYAVRPCSESAFIVGASDNDVHIAPALGFDSSMRSIKLSLPPCEFIPPSFELALLAADTPDASISADLWHARLGHFGIARIHRTLIDHRIDALKGFNAGTCTASLAVKRRKGHPSKPTNSIEFKYFGQRIDSDIAGSFPARGIM